MKARTAVAGEGEMPATWPRIEVTKARDREEGKDNRWDGKNKNLSYDSIGI